MITGILNSVVQLDLSQTDVDKFKVLEINYTKKEIILSNGSKKFECKILKENVIDQSYIVRINGEISTIRLIKQVEKTIEKLGIQKENQKNINVLKAPMPGLILDVVIKESELVKKGDPVIILEAKTFTSQDKVGFISTVGSLAILAK